MKLKDYLTYSPSYGAMLLGMRKITVPELANVLAMAYSGLRLRHLEQPSPGSASEQQPS